MNEKSYGIPGRLNFFICCVSIGLLSTILVLTAFVTEWYHILILSITYGFLMNTGYALFHEAEHNLLFEKKWLNNSMGVLLGFFFPAPFHLLRQGHLGHHMRNRSDDEAFDYYFAEEKPFFRFVQLYSLLTGLFWFSIFAMNFVLAVFPGIMQAKFWRFDRPSEELAKSLNVRYKYYIQAEAIFLILGHGCLIYFLNIYWLNYFLVFFGFGYMWSALQYLHHFGTVRDVKKGAKNLRTYGWLDALWLNHNWHLNHHMHPTISWIHLPKLGNDQGRERMLINFFRMFRGPRFTTERLENRFSGQVIR